MSYTVSYIANSYYGLAVWRAVAFNDHSTRVREMGKKRQLLARSRLEKDVFSSYVALQSARSLPPAPNSLSLRGWFFDDVDPPRRLKGDYYTCSYRGHLSGKKDIGNLLFLHSCWWFSPSGGHDAPNKSEEEHHTAAMLAHVESLATSCMQSSKANREIERRFAVARHEPKDVVWCDSTQIPTPPEKLASCSVLVHNSAHHLLPQIT